MGSLKASVTYNYYEIDARLKSESAWLLFAHHSVTKKQVVMKVLRKYKDIRYSLRTVKERQQCQLEALKWNSIFTPGIYLGLARISKLDRRYPKIFIDEVVENPGESELDQDAEYALLMRLLPEERRLDNLLEKGDEALHQHYMQLLVERVIDMHTHLTPFSIEEGERWSGSEQLQIKLLHNFACIDKALKRIRNNQESSYVWFKDVTRQLKRALTQVFVGSQYELSFKQRIEQHYIKRCHGDLKAPNIWIMPTQQEESVEKWQDIYVLDAIDFNPMYSNIDILSDFAMLVIDIQARTESSKLAHDMIEYYLKLTGQQDEVARSVLAYYLIEKAIVGAASSMMYDHLADLSRSYLNIGRLLLDGLRMDRDM